MLPRIVVDLERLCHLHCGLGQYSLHLGRQLLQLAREQLRFSFLLPKAGAPLVLDGSFDVLTAEVWRREMVQRALRPLVLPLARGQRFDLWHMTHQNTRFWPWDTRLPVVFTVHDLNFLREKRPASIRRRMRDLQAKVDRATAITTISQFVADELAEHVQLRGKTVEVVYNGATPGQRETSTRPMFLSDAPFLFTIGDILAKKNFHVLLDLIERLPGKQLVIAGNKTSEYAQAIEAQARERGLADRVFLPGKISDGERYWLYQHCEGFVFPSLTEGFGLPVIEAMSLGRPVFVSHATSLPEVAGPLGFYFHAYDGEHLASVYQQGLDAFARDRDYSRKLQAHAAQFTWEKCARGYLDVYRRVLSEAKQQRAA